LDSIGRPPSGILDVTMSDYGDYDQCLEVLSPTAEGDEDFRGQHCNIQVEHPHIPALTKHAISKLPQLLKEDSVYKDVLLTYTRLQTAIGVRVGICVPSSCSKDDIFKMLNPAAANLKLGVHVASCETKAIVTITEEQLVVICIFGLLGTLLLCGALLEIIINTLPRPLLSDDFKQKARRSLLAAFGPFRNFKQLLSSEDRASSLHCLHGIRVVTMFWIVLTQTYLNLEFQAVRSGLLLATTVLRNFDEKNSKKQMFGIFVYRYLRITPGCLLALCFFTLVPLMGSGPIWREKIVPQVAACNQTWWAVALNVNNFIHADGMCLPSLWYISADWQLHCALFPLVFLLIRKPAFGGMAAFAAVVVFGVIIGVQTTLSGYPPTFLPLYAEKSRVRMLLQEVVMRPYTHAGPFTIGICTSFVLLKYPRRRFSKVSQALLWGSSLLLMGFSLLGTWRWNRNIEASDLETLLYSSLHRSAWALGLAWLVYASDSNRGGLLNRTLSWRVWVPLSRLTYAVYLIHPIVLFFQFWTIRERIYGSHLTMVYLYLCNMAFNIGMAVPFYLCFEAPFRSIAKDSLEKLLGCSLRQRKTSTSAAHCDGAKKACESSSNAIMDMTTRNGDVATKMTAATVHL
ncbi:hypothetical protein HPB47_011154, partial [Ixodes persulcatus]